MVSQQEAEADAQFQAEEYTLFDKIMYGGFGYGEYCFPSNTFRYIITSQQSRPPGAGARFSRGDQR